MRIAVIENHALATNTIRRDLMEALIHQGHELYILTGESDLFSKLDEEGFNMVKIGVSKLNPFAVLNYMLSLRKVLKEVKPDVCLTFTIRPGIYGNIITRFLRIRTISNITGIGPLFDNNGLTYRIARFLYSISLRRTSKVFFQNYDDMNSFIDRGYVRADQSSRIPGSGINYQKYVPREFIGDKDVVSFIFISRLIKDKGILDYVNAASIVKSKYPNVIFYVVGPFYLQGLRANTITKEEVISWEKEGIIQYLGETSDVRSVIPKANCVVLPSYREGISNILLEASSMAVPVIATNVTGCKEIVDDGITGFLCRVRDPEDLSKKMIRLMNLSDEERNSMGELAREKVKKEFDKQIVVKAYLDEIKDVNRNR